MNVADAVAFLINASQEHNEWVSTLGRSNRVPTASIDGQCYPEDSTGQFELTVQNATCEARTFTVTVTEGRR